MSFAVFSSGCQTCSMKVLCRPMCPRVFGKTSARASGPHSPSWPSRSTASRCRRSHVAAIAREKETENCVIVGNKCVNETGNETYDTGETEKVAKVDDAYLEQQEPVVTEQLKRAGVRLAYLLNTTLGK